MKTVREEIEGLDGPCNDAEFDLACQMACDDLNFHNAEFTVQEYIDMVRRSMKIIRERAVLAHG